MKLFTFTLLAIFLAAGHADSSAQREVGPQVEASNVAESMLATYVSWQMGTWVRARTIGSIHARGRRPTPRNAASVRSALAKKVTPDESISLLRILGSLYTSDNESGMTLKS